MQALYSRSLLGPTVTPKIIGAGVVALKEAYLESFRSVWIAVCCFCAVGVVGKISHQVSIAHREADKQFQARCFSSIPPKI